MQVYPQNRIHRSIFTLNMAVIHGSSTSSLMDTTTASLVPYWSLPGRVLLSMTMIIIMSVAVFGNALVILVIARNQGMQTRTNFFLMNLAIADFLCGCIDMPFSLVTVVRGEWIFSDIVCQMNSFATPFFFVASIHTLMYIAIFKYMSIHNPFRFALSCLRILLMIGAAWVWAAIIGMLSVVGLSKAEFEEYTTQCGPKYYHDPKSYTYFAIVFITCYVIPLGAISTCYVGMFREIRSHGRRLRNTSTFDRDKIYAQQRSILVTLLVVVIAFVVTWTPWIVYSLYAIVVSDDNRVVHWINPIMFWFGYANSACNPVIYALRSQSFREGYKQVVAKRGPKGDGYIGAAENCRGIHFWHTRSLTESSFLQRNSTREKSRYVETQPIRRRLSSTGSLPEGFVTGLGHDMGFSEYIPLSHFNGNPQPAPLVIVESEPLHHSTRAELRGSVRTGHHESSRAKRHESVEPRHRLPQIVMSDSVEVETEPVVLKRGERSRLSRRAKAAQHPMALAPKLTFKEVRGLAPNLKQWLISRKLGRVTENPDVIEVFMDIQTFASLHDAFPSSGLKSNLAYTLSKEYAQSVCSLCSNPECEIKDEESHHGKHKTYGHAKKSQCKRTSGQYQRKNTHKTEQSKPLMCRFPSIDELDKVQPKHRLAPSASTRHRNPFVLVEKWYHRHKLGLKPERERENWEEGRPLNRDSYEYEHILPGMFRSASAPCL